MCLLRVSKNGLETRLEEYWGGPFWRLTLSLSALVSSTVFARGRVGWDIVWVFWVPWRPKLLHYHSTGNLYSQSIIFQELISICSYSSAILQNFLFKQLQFLSLGGLCSYTGPSFTGTRPPFQKSLERNSTSGRRASKFPGQKNSTLGCRASKVSGKTALLGAERAKSLEKLHVGCRANKVPKRLHFGVQSEQDPWKDSTFGCRANKIVGSGFVLFRSGLVCWWDILYRWNFGGSYLFMQLQLAKVQDLIL